MKPKIRMTPAARADLQEVRKYISEDNPQAAKKTIQLLQIKCTLLARSPKIGVSHERYRGLHMFPVGSYLIFYRPNENGVDIIRVLHASRDIDTIMAR